MRRWTYAAVAAASVVLAVAVASARDGSPEVSPEEEFADSLCAIGIRHAREMYEVHDRVVYTRAAPGRREGWEPLYLLALQARWVALEYRDDVKSLRLPDVSDDVKAARALDLVARDPLGQVTDFLVVHIRALPRNLTLVQSIRNLNRMQSLLVHSIGSMVEGGFFTLLVPELADAFDNAESCKRTEAELARAVED